MTIYRRWAQQYMEDVQAAFVEMVVEHFPTAHAAKARDWTLALSAGCFRDLGLIPLLVSRGMMVEAGMVIRRALENLGVLAHLWVDPGKSSVLEKSDSKEFKGAFTTERDKKAALALQARGVQKRFAANHMAGPMSAA